MKKGEIAPRLIKTLLNNKYNKHRSDIDFSLKHKSDNSNKNNKSDSLNVNLLLFLVQYNPLCTFTVI